MKYILIYNISNQTYEIRNNYTDDLIKTFPKYKGINALILRDELNSNGGVYKQIFSKEDLV